MNLGMTPSEYEALTERAKFLPTPPELNPVAPVVPPSLPVVQPSAAQLNERERMVQSLAKEHKGKSRAALQGFLGKDLGSAVADAIQSQTPTLKQILGKRQQKHREADAECGKAMATAGIQVRQHSVQDYTHVIVTQLDLLQDGANPSVSAVVNAAFPDDPKKATSIRNSRHAS